MYSRRYSGEKNTSCVRPCTDTLPWRTDTDTFRICADATSVSSSMLMMKMLVGSVLKMEARAFVKNWNWHKTKYQILGHLVQNQMCKCYHAHIGEESSPGHLVQNQMYKSYLEQWGEDGSLGHFVQNQIHVQVLLWAGMRGLKLSGSSCSESEMYKSYLEKGGEDGSLGHLVQNQMCKSYFEQGWKVSSCLGHLVQNQKCTNPTLNREERTAVWVILFRIRWTSLTLSRDERFQAVWVILFRIRSTSLTLNRKDRISLGHLGQNQIYRSYLNRLARMAVWVILFRIRCAGLILNRAERMAAWVILFKIRYMHVQVLPWTGRKGWQPGSSCSKSDTYMYKSYLEQGGKDGSLGHLVQNQIHVQVLPWTGRKGKQSGSSCSDVWWHCHGASLGSPVAHTDDRWPSPHSSHLMTKRCIAICTARTANQGKRQTVVPWKRNTAFFSLFLIGLYASTEVFCLQEVSILWQSQTAVIYLIS